MRLGFRLMLVLIPLIAGIALTVVIAGGGDETPSGERAAAATTPAPELPPIQGLQIGVEGLIYNVTDVRLLDFDSPSAAPYLTNLQRPAKGNAYLGVFLRVYNPTGRATGSAPGFLLEPSKNPELVEQNKATESPYSFKLGASVPAKGVIPEPGSAAASGQFPGGLLLYNVTSNTTKAQPLDLVIHTSKGAIAKLRLPPVPQVNGKPGHG